ncbi:MAG: hypothetical protein IKM34_07455 [Clostridia bacterium]|nr:hypothetical protein [Clostridia bacterium]
MNDSLHIIAGNLLKEQTKLSRLYRRYPLYLEELARELIPKHITEVGDEELAISYRQMKEELSSLTKKEKDDGEEVFFSAQEPILSAKLAYEIAKKAKINRYLPTLAESGSQIAYYRNAYSDLAFRRFAKELNDPTVLYRESFAAVCEEVYADRCDFAILPVESSRDGLLSVTQKLVTKYELAPVFYCTVPTTDDGTLRFGLFASAPLVPPKADSLEILLFSDDEASLSRLLSSATTLGISLKSLSMLSSAQSFSHEWKLVFSAKEGNDTSFDAFWILLLCEYPHHYLCGICQSLA